MATINDQDEQFFMESILPTGGTGWLGGYQTELPEEKLIWHSNESCDDNDVYYSDWAEGFPRFSTEDDENFLFTTGSSDKNIHGDWMHTSGSAKMGYILEDVKNSQLESILESEGTTFVLEDKVNLANKKQYKVLNITEDSNGLYSVNGLEYNVDKFDNIEKDLSIKQPEHPVIFTEGNIFDDYENTTVSQFTSPPVLDNTQNNIQSSEAGNSTEYSTNDSAGESTGESTGESNEGENNNGNSSSY